MESGTLIIRPKRPKGEDGYKVFSIRIKEDTASAIDEIAAQTGRSRNELIGMFLDYAARHCKIEDPGSIDIEYLCSPWVVSLCQQDDIRDVVEVR